MTSQHHWHARTTARARIGFVRIWTATLIAFLLFGLGACSREDQQSADSQAHKAGREAYKIAHDTKEAAEKAGQKLRKAGEEARQGWNEAKHEDQAKPDK
jgi:hypothetical protein